VLLLLVLLGRVPVARRGESGFRWLIIEPMHFLEPRQQERLILFFLGLPVLPSL
jgi:hypothetical protein